MIQMDIKPGGYYMDTSLFTGVFVSGILINIRLKMEQDEKDLIYITRK